MTAQVVRRRDGHTVVDVDDGCPEGNHRRDELCAYLPLPMLPPVDEPEPEDDRGGAT